MSRLIVGAGILRSEGLAAGVCIGLGLALQFFLTPVLQKMTTHSEETLRREVQADFNPKVYQILSFGQLPSVVDWLWITVLQDDAITHVRKGTHPEFYYTLNLVSDLDPAFRGAYQSGALLLSVIRDDGPGALSLLEKGERFRKNELPHYPREFKEEQWPADWPLLMLKAYVLYFDLDDLVRAADAFREVAALPSSPPYVQHLVSRLNQTGGYYEVGLKLLEFMIPAQKDPEVRRSLTERRNSLRVSWYLFDLSRQLTDFMESQHLSKEDLQKTEFRGRIWTQFLSKRQLSGVDPWGGQLSLSERGDISSTTPHQKVFGLQ